MQEAAMHCDFFEALEGRALLSAPVAAPQFFSVPAESMTLVGRYSASTGVDASSIDPNDTVVTGPGGLARLAESATMVSQDAGSATVRYVLRSGPAGVEHSMWPNGTFNLGVPGGSVRS